MTVKYTTCNFEGAELIRENEQEQSILQILRRKINLVGRARNKREEKLAELWNILQIAHVLSSGGVTTPGDKADF